MRRLRGIATGILIRSMDSVITYGSKSAKDYQIAGISADSIFIAYNATDSNESERYLAELECNSDWVQPWKMANLLDPDLPTMLFVGRLIPEKCVDFLIRACAPLCGKCQLLIVGDGPSRLDLESLAEGLKNRAQFVGHKSGLDLARCFIASDIFALPGSGGLAIHQAMSYGKPILVSFGDGTERDVVRDGRNGFFVQEGVTDDLTAKIKTLIDNPDLCMAMGQESRRIVREEINIDAMVSSFICAIGETMERSASNNF